MRKLLFIPFSIAAGLVAGFTSKKLFDAAWSLVDDEEPPEPEHRDVSWPRVAEGETNKDRGAKYRWLLERFRLRSWSRIRARRSST